MVIREHIWIFLGLVTVSLNIGCADRANNGANPSNVTTDSTGDLDAGQDSGSINGDGGSQCLETEDGGSVDTGNDASGDAGSSDDASATTPIEPSTICQMTWCSSRPTQRWE